MSVELHNEKELFLQIAEGNEAAFRTIFHAYNARLFPVMVNITKSESEAEEVMQNVFLKLWMNRETLPGIDNPGGWLYRVASNLALSALRSKATSLKHIQSIQERQSEADDSLQLELNASELKNLVAEAVQKLPTGRRQVYEMSRNEGLDRQEIAKRTGLSESTVKNQLSSALRFIQSYISKKHGIYLPAIFFLPFY